MSRVEQLEQEISALDATELRDLRAWFDRYDADLWDRQIEQDSKSGKLRSLIEQAIAEDRHARRVRSDCRVELRPIIVG